MADPLLTRLTRAYAALGKNPAASPLYRLNPQLANREHLTSGATAGGMEIDRYAAHATIYRQYVWVRKAITTISTALAPLPCVVVDADGVPVPLHPLNGILRQPNPVMDWPELVEIMLVHKLLGGEWFLEVVTDQRGAPVELWPRRPDEVWVVGDTTQPGYPVPIGYQVPTLTPPFIAADAMIHEKFVNPLNDWRGISVIGAARDEIAVDLSVLQNTLRSTTDGTRQYAITTDEALTETERRRIEQQLEAKYGRHRPMMLESGQQIATFGSAPDDLEWLAARDYSREAVGALFGVPDEIMGFGRDTYENFDTAYRVFWLLTLQPIAQRRDATLTQFFTKMLPMLAPGQRIITDMSSVGVLQEALEPKLAQAQALWSLGVPYNTIEAVLRLGTGPIPGGDVGYLASSVLPISDVATPPMPTAQRTAKAITKSRTFARSLQRLRQQHAARLAPRIEVAFDALADTVIARAEAQADAVQRSKDVRQLTLESLIADADFAGILEVIRLGIIELLGASWELWNTALDLELAFEQSDPAVVDALRNSAQRITGISETTRTAVQALLQFGATEGWTLTQLVEGTDERPGLRSIVAETYKRRHMTIARTELGTAQNQAAANRYRRAGVTRVLILDNGFDDSHPECTRLDGTTQTLEWYEANPLQHPNCVRAAAPIVED